MIFLKSSLKIFSMCLFFNKNMDLVENDKTY